MKTVKEICMKTVWIAFVYGVPRDIHLYEEDIKKRWEKDFCNIPGLQIKKCEYKVVSD